MHPKLLREGFLRDALVFQLGQQRLQGHTLQIRLHVSERTDVHALLGCDDLKPGGIMHGSAAACTCTSARLWNTVETQGHGR